MAEILCRWEYTIFDGDNGFLVCRYRNVDEQSVFVASGYYLPEDALLQCRLKGQWEKNTKGWTFIVSEHSIELPMDAAGITQYLCAMKCGIGTNAAKLLYENFGPRIWTVIENDPVQLKQVRGCGRINLEKLVSHYGVLVQTRRLMDLFHPSTPDETRKIHALARALGEDAVLQLRENPYLVCLHGYTFAQADDLAMRMGYDRRRPERTGAAIELVLRKSEGDGNVYTRMEDMSKAIHKIIAANSYGLDVSERNITETIRYLSERGEVVHENGAVYRNVRYQEECSIAADLVRLSVTNGIVTAKLPVYIQEYEKNAGIHLDDQQRKAITDSFMSCVHVITGGPGTGKTTILRGVLFCHEQICKQLDIAAEPLLMAPTGRAARRMAEATGHDATTIHKALGLRPEDDESAIAATPLYATLVVIDEASMLDSHIASMLFHAIRTGTQVIIVGDTDQLPSVGCGNVLREIIRSQCISVTRLNTIFRQSGGNSIVFNAKQIRDGELGLIWNDNFAPVYAPEPEHVYTAAVNLYCKCVRQFGVKNVMLLNPYRAKGAVSAVELNRRIQARFNPLQDGEKEMKLKEYTFRNGDMIMQTRNTDLVSNGDIGRIVAVSSKSAGRGKNIPICRVEFYIGKNGTPVTLEYERKDMEHVVLAYCCTVHKSQGGEFDTVIMILHDSQKNMLKRNLLYTGVTRAIHRVAIVGTGSALRMAIETEAVDRRNTMLAERIRLVRQEGVATTFDHRLVS